MRNATLRGVCGVDTFAPHRNFSSTRRTQSEIRSQVRPPVRRAPRGALVLAAAWRYSGCRPTRKSSRRTQAPAMPTAASVQDPTAISRIRAYSGSPFHGLEPTLSLSYDSSRFNGFVGVGWSLSGLSSIQRAHPCSARPATTRRTISSSTETNWSRAPRRPAKCATR